MYILSPLILISLLIRLILAKYCLQFVIFASFVIPVPCETFHGPLMMIINIV